MLTILCTEISNRFVYATATLLRENKFKNQENILVTADGCPVISGFNYSALVVREGYNLYSGGSSRWMSPETIVEIDTWPVSKARDVWAFGMTVYVCLLIFLSFVHD